MGIEVECLYNMELITTLLLCCLMLPLLYKYLFADSRKSRPPGPKSSPIVGSAFDVDIRKFHEQAYEYALQFGKICEINVFNLNILFLNSVDVVNKAFCDEHYKHIINDRPSTAVGKYAFLNKSIFVSQAGKRHADLRKAFAKGLHVYGDGIARFENIMKAELHCTLEKIGECNGAEFEVFELAKRSVSNVISILFTGEPATDEDVKNIYGFLDGGDYLFTPLPNTLMMTFPFLRFCPPLGTKFEAFMQARQRSLDKIFHKTKKTRQPGITRGLVDFFLEEQEREIVEGREPVLTDEQIQVIAIETFSAGIVTTASTLASSLIYLINNPDYQTRVQDELDRVLGSNREPSIQDKYDHNLDLLEAVVMETLRLAPPTPLGLPHVCSQDLQLEGYQIKKNTQVFANLFFIHRDEKIWGDPWAFRPERFLDETGKLLPSSHVYMKKLVTYCSWIPFGTGRRKCPGLTLGMTRIFLYLSHLLQKWSFIPSRNQMSCDPRGAGYEGGTILKPKPFYCKAKPRK